MSINSESDELERLKLENARLKAALNEAEFECQRLSIINSNLELQLNESNRELEKNIEALQGFKSDIEALVSSVKKINNE